MNGDNLRSSPAFSHNLLRSRRKVRPVPRRSRPQLHALANRNLAVGCFLIFMRGAAIYSLTSVLPVFYQTLMGYDATGAGFVVSPRGLGSIVAAIAVGALTAKIDPRIFGGAGFGCLALSTLWMSLLTLDTSPRRPLRAVT